LSLGELMMHAQSFGTAPLDRLVVAVRAAQDRLQRGPEREPNLGNAGCRSCLHGTGLLDQLAAAVRAAQDRLQRGPDREEVHAQSGPPGPPPAGAAAVAPARPPSGGAPFGASTSSPKSTRFMLYTSSLGTVLLDQIAAAVNAARRRFQRVPDQESNLGNSGCIRCPSVRCCSTSSPPRYMPCRGQIMMHTLSRGPVYLDQLGAAVQAVQGRLQREPDRTLSQTGCEAIEGGPAVTSPELNPWKVLSPSAGLQVQGRRLRARSRGAGRGQDFLENFAPSQPPCDGRVGGPPGSRHVGPGGNEGFGEGVRSFFRKGGAPKFARRAPPRGDVRAGRLPRGGRVRDASSSGPLD